MATALSLGIGNNLGLRVFWLTGRLLVDQVNTLWQAPGVGLVRAGASSGKRRFNGFFPVWRPGNLEALGRKKGWIGQNTIGQGLVGPGNPVGLPLCLPRVHFGPCLPLPLVSLDFHILLKNTGGPVGKLFPNFPFSFQEPGRNITP